MLSRAAGSQLSTPIHSARWSCSGLFGSAIACTKSAYPGTPPQSSGGVREGFKEERTACINRIRGILAEFGLVFNKSPKALRAKLADVIEDASNELSARARWVLQPAFEHWRELDEHMRWSDRQVGQHVRSCPQAKRAAKINGIGELGASAMTASVGDFKQFRAGHQFGAWMGRSACTSLP